MKIPKRWLNYTPIGQQIPSTRFICFKAPLELSQPQLDTIKLDNQLTPDLLLEHVPNLGLIIDLTEATKFYNPDFFIEKGIEHRKIRIRGKILVPRKKHEEFAKAVTKFLLQNSTKLIGVHCTHGCNRTGLPLCTFLVEHCKFSPGQAIEYFETARGHKIERSNYVQAINDLSSNVSNMQPNIASSNWRIKLKDEGTSPAISVNVSSNNLNAMQSQPMSYSSVVCAATDVKIQQSDSGSGLEPHSSRMDFHNVTSGPDTSSKIAATNHRLLENLVLKANKNNPDGNSLNRERQAGKSYRSSVLHNTNRSSNNSNYGNQESGNLREEYIRYGSRFGSNSSKYRDARTTHGNHRTDRESKQDFIMNMKMWRSGDK